MIISTIDGFIEAIPTAQGTEFGVLKPYVSDAETEIMSVHVLGKALFDHIAALDHTDQLWLLLRNTVANMAYRNAIPFVDLIQTNNGFAVVSSSNQAPASKERVERLIAQCDAMVDRNMDLLIIQIMATPVALGKWEPDALKLFTSCLFITGIDYAGSTMAKCSRTDFLKAKPVMLNAQDTVLAPAISRAYLDELITKNRTREWGAVDLPVVDACKQILAMHVAGKDVSAKKRLDQLLVNMESMIDSFPTYKASAEYALKNSDKYVNKLEDPTFFFGI